jgi:putrescine aminotransferase
MAGLWCVNVGHGRQEIGEAVRAQMSELSYYNTFFKTTHPPVIELSEMLSDLAPEHMNMVFYGGSGSEANDTIFAWYATIGTLKGSRKRRPSSAARTPITARPWPAHPSAAWAACISRATCRLPAFITSTSPTGSAKACMTGMSEDEFGSGPHANSNAPLTRSAKTMIAAFIAEPIQGAGGVIIPPATYWPEVKRILE